jgi:hypothetical protein
MPLANTLPAAIVETILTHFATLFLTGAGGDPSAARHAAAQMLAAYHPETPIELRLAANIIGFSFHALEALGQATIPNMSLNRILRLRGSAVRRLDRLQQARRQGMQPLQADIQKAEAQPEPKIEQALALIQETSAIAVAAKADGLTWTQAYEQRQRDTRIAASLKRAEARSAAQPTPATPGAISNHPQPATAHAT